MWPRLSAAAGIPIWQRPSYADEVFADLPRLERVLQLEPRPIALDDASVLTDDQVREHANAWVVYRQVAWAWDSLDRMIYAREYDLAWPLVFAIVEQGSNRALACLGENALSDLLKLDGPQIIDRAEAEAARSVRFRYCLSGVSPFGDPPDVWTRVEKARGASANKEHVCSRWAGNDDAYSCRDGVGKVSRRSRSSTHRTTSLER
ncbi:MAG: DUF6869 domain-containing protein [Gemmatimonadaceae bacterium]